MKQCPHCGANLREDANFCIYCMTALKEKPILNPIKFFGRWQRICAIALLVCIFLGIGIFLASFFGTHYQSQPEHQPSDILGSQDDSNSTESNLDKNSGVFNSDWTDLLENSDTNGTTEITDTDVDTDSITNSDTVTDKETTKTTSKQTTSTSTTNSEHSSSSTKTTSSSKKPSSSTTSTTTSSKKPSTSTNTTTDNGGNPTDSSTNNPSTVVTFASGKGTASDPYIIETKEQLNQVRYHLSSHFKLNKDIVFSESDFIFGGDYYRDPDNDSNFGFAPIGQDKEHAFTGTFDGNGHVIKNLFMFCGGLNTSSIGLFGYCKGIIKNLGMENSDIHLSTDSTCRAGGIVGTLFSSSAAIINCYNTGKVEAGGSVGHSEAGGIAGRVEDGATISNCYNTGSIFSTSDGYAGGIVGKAISSSIIEKCYNTGEIFGDYSCGGILGDAGNGTIISDCYNAGKVLSNYSVGGIVGYIFEGYNASESDFSSIQNCYNVGKVEMNHHFTGSLGGIGGRIDGTTKNCYYLEPVLLVSVSEPTTAPSVPMLN